MQGRCAMIVSRIRVGAGINERANNRRIVTVERRLVKWGLAVLVSDIRIGAGIKQSQHNSFASVSRRFMQRLVAPVIARSRIGAGFEQRDDNRGIAVPTCRPNKGSTAILVASLKIRARVQ